MKRVLILLALLILASFIFIPQVFYKVDETNQAIVLRFGAVKTTSKNPGLYIKAPFVDQVIYFDKRLLIFDAPPESILTDDKKRLIVDVYARAHITDPVTFYKTLTSEALGKAQAIDILSSELRTEFAKDQQAEIVTTKRNEIMEQIKSNMDSKYANFGLTLLDVRIKRADFPDAIQESVYTRMRSERKRKADKERAEGAKIDLEVRADVDKKAAIIKAEAKRDAEKIKGEGDAEAIIILANAMEKDPEFYNFQRTLQAYRIFIDSQTTIVLPAESELFQFLEDPSEINEK
ncbi:MAG: protease modulator HflC [Chloroflexi bacterium]|jgi:membrane protease subunit HflC|nr:protease modulator HflC [Chloroflexota bacterium]MCH2304759.1 protease modulator HflC [SAR202 cluster bacterium]|tara:strand:- start:1766 stop:2638 length:873 start_codon:yes stop_codon:yes gene_type:complete